MKNNEDWNFSESGKRAIKDARIGRGKTYSDYERGTTTIIISKFITPNPTRFRSILTKFG